MPSTRIFSSSARAINRQASSAVSIRIPPRVFFGVRNSAARYCALLMIFCLTLKVRHGGAKPRSCLCRLVGLFLFQGISNQLHAQLFAFEMILTLIEGRVDFERERGKARQRD